MPETLFYLTVNAVTAVAGLLIALYRVQKKAYWTVNYIFILAHSILIGLRDPSANSDTRAYIMLFLGDAYFSDRVEPLFMALLSSIRLISRDIDFFLIVYALLLNLIFIHLFHLFSRKRALLLFALFAATNAYWLSHVQLMRNGLAASIFLLSLHWLYQSRKKSAAAIAAIGSSIHFSVAIVAIFSFLTFHLRNQRLHTKIALVAGTAVSILSIFYFIERLDFFAPWRERLVAYSYYAENDFRNSTIGFQHIFLPLIAALSALNWKRLPENYKNLATSYLSISILSFIFWFNILYRDRIFLSAQILEPIIIYELTVFHLGHKLASISVFFLSLTVSSVILFIWLPRSGLLT